MLFPDSRFVFKLICSPCLCSQVCDTSSSECFRASNRSYFKNTSAVVIVFDHSRFATLVIIESWYGYVENIIKSSSSPYVFIVGNKSDAISEPVRKFNEAEATKLAAEYNAEYWSVSAATAENVDRLFERIGTILFYKSIKDRIILAQQAAKKSAMEKQMILEKATNKAKVRKFKLACCFDWRRFFKRMTTLWQHDPN